MNKSTQNILVGTLGIALGFWIGNKNDSATDCGSYQEEQEKKDDAKTTIPKKAAQNTRQSTPTCKPLSKRAGSSPKHRKIRKQKTSTTSRRLSIPALFEKNKRVDFNQRYAGYKKAQVSFYNPTDRDVEVSLWGVNRNANTSILRDRWHYQEIEAPVDIQATAYNPANGFVYLLSQLGNSLEVHTPSGDYITHIDIKPNAYPGMSSPVALTVNTNVSSSTYGWVYVISSIADTLSIIDTHHQLVHTVDLPDRPIEILYQEQHNRLYVLSLLKHQIVALDAETFEVLQTVNTPIQNPLVGQFSADGQSLHISYLKGHEISSYDLTLNLIETIENVLDNPKAMSLSLEEDELLIVQENGEVLALNTQSGTISQTGLDQVRFIQPNPNDTYQLIQENGDVSVLDSQFQRTETYSFQATHGILLWEEDTNLMLFDALDSRLYYQGIESQGVEFDEDYEERRQDFKYNPALVKHVRFSMSGDTYFPTLKLVHQNATGKIREQTLSLNDYRSPQNFQNILDATGLEGSFLDGQTAWKLRIAAGQRISAMLYYTQLEMYRLMPEHSRKVIPII